MVVFFCISIMKQKDEKQTFQMLHHRTSPTVQCLVQITSTENLNKILLLLPPERSKSFPFHKKKKIQTQHSNRSLRDRSTLPSGDTKTGRSNTMKQCPSHSTPPPVCALVQMIISNEKSIFHPFSYGQRSRIITSRSLAHEHTVENATGSRGERAHRKISKAN